MNFNKTLITLFLASLLSACGGNDGSGGFFGADGNTPSDPPDDPTDPVVTPVDLALGTGSGGLFVSGGMTTSIDGAELSYGGSASVTVNVVNSSNNALYTAAPVVVSFTSNCVAQGDSTIAASVSTSTGVASATYRALTCEESDTITATLSDGSRASTTIDIASQSLGSLVFVSATPSIIALQGNGSSNLPEVSELIFSLEDPTGQPIQGRTVGYTLSTTAGGISLSNTESVTEDDGTTSINVNAGRTPISVSVTAEVTSGGRTLRTTSRPIAIVGAMPDQNSFSLSVETFNPAGWDTDGVTSSLTIRAADRNNNPAPDGTQILFRASAGVIDGSCELANGVCSVDWSSQSPRPVNIGSDEMDTDCDSDFLDPRNRKVGYDSPEGDACGLVKILARTTGEESFRDVNSNGFYDVGEPILTQLAEAYLDENVNGSYDLGEFFSDFDESEDFDGNPLFVPEGGGSEGNLSLFQGVGCSSNARGVGHCNNLVEVRQTATLCMSTDLTYVYKAEPPEFIGSNSALDWGTTPKEINLDGDTIVHLQFTDAHGLTPSSGTSFTVTGKDVEVVSTDLVVPNECVVGGFLGSITLKAKDATADGNPATTGTVTLAIDQADGLGDEMVFRVRD